MTLSSQSMAGQSWVSLTSSWHSTSIPLDQVSRIDVLRAGAPMCFYVSVKVYHEDINDLADIPGLQKSLIRRLNILSRTWTTG